MKRANHLPTLNASLPIKHSVFIKWPTPLITLAAYKYQNTHTTYPVSCKYLIPKGNRKTVAYIITTKKVFKQSSGSCIQQINKGDWPLISNGYNRNKIEYCVDTVEVELK